MPDSLIDQRGMSIDGLAGTVMYRFDGDLSKLAFLKYDITNLAYSIRHAGRAAVIGWVAAGTCCRHNSSASKT